MASIVPARGPGTMAEARRVSADEFRVVVCFKDSSGS